MITPLLGPDAFVMVPPAANAAQWFALAVPDVGIVVLGVPAEETHIFVATTTGPP